MIGIEEEKLPSGIVELNGQKFMPDAKGALVPEALVKAEHKLEDETVRKIMSFAISLSKQVERFKAYTMNDLSDLDGVLEQEYGFVKKGNKGKGNRTYMTHNALFKVSVQVADYIDFGSQLQIAKQLIDECLNEWAANARPEIQAIVTRAFNTDKQGQINRSEIFMLLRLEIKDSRWLQAMSAIRDAMRVVGSKEYVRFAMRSAPDEEWNSVTINLARA